MLELWRVGSKWPTHAKRGEGSCEDFFLRSTQARMPVLLKFCFFAGCDDFFSCGFVFKTIQLVDAGPRCGQDGNDDFQTSLGNYIAMRAGNLLDDSMRS